MKAKIFSFVRVSEHSNVASVRIAQYLRDTLGLELCWDESISGQYDILIIINGAYAFAGSGVLESLAVAIENSEQVVWVQNDYTVIPPKDESGAESPFRKAFRNRHDSGKSAINYWTTCKLMSYPGRAKSGHIVGDKSAYMNWNALTFTKTNHKPFSDRLLRDVLVYYGSFRKDRVPYFHRYFANPTVSTLISDLSGRGKFEDAFQSLYVTHESKFDDVGDFIGECGLGLYLEDKKSHVEFHSPANRFYEMLGAGLPMVFQPECMNMMKQAGYDLGGHILWNVNEAPEMMAKKEELYEVQQAEWCPRAEQDRVNLGEQLLKAWSELA